MAAYHLSRRVAVLGAGSFGVAFAKVVAQNGHRVTLWARRKEIAEAICQNHCHPHKLRQVMLPRSIQATHDLEEALRDVDFVVSALPMLALRIVFQKAQLFLPPQVKIVSTTKGIEPESWKFPSQVLDEVLGVTFDKKTAFLSGPSFALEVAQDLPTALVVAAQTPEVCEQVRQILQNQTLHLTASEDVTGLEVCGAFKNVVAIAAGLVEGLGLGTNAKAALVTKGLQEISQLAMAMGGKSQTVYGLGGIGDLILTCYGELSRNRSVGLELAAKKSLADILSTSAYVAEGVHTAKAVMILNKKFKLNLPVLQSVYQILFQSGNVEKMVKDVLN